MNTHGALTISAFKWVPPFAQGQVRDHRLRWMLKEVGWDYSVELIDSQVQRSDRYRAEQPFCQVPVLREEGRATLFETGAIVLDVAERSGQLLPGDPDGRALAKSWLFAALNSVEPYLMEIALADFFIKDPDLARSYRSFAEPLAVKQLASVAAALGRRQWLVGDDFSIADLMMASVSKIVGHTDMIETHANLAQWRDRCFARPAQQAALAEQCADFSGHGPRDMGWPDELAEPKQSDQQGEQA